MERKITMLKGKCPKCGEEKIARVVDSFPGVRGTLTSKPYFKCQACGTYLHRKK